jgi:mgpa family protein
VSLRSNNTALDVSAVAAHFAGGGHKMAAGCSLKGDAASILEKIIAELRKQMDEPDFPSNKE